jgi:Flp pilus assembly pilin Flp
VVRGTAPHHPWSLHMTRLTDTIGGTVARLCRDEGQDLLEYGLLAGLIALVAVSAVTGLGNQIHTVMWQHIVNNF